MRVKQRKPGQKEMKKTEKKIKKRERNRAEHGIQKGEAD